MFLVLEGTLLVDLEGESIVLTAPCVPDPDFGPDSSVRCPSEDAPCVHGALCGRADSV